MRSLINERRGRAMERRRFGARPAVTLHATPHLRTIEHQADLEVRIAAIGYLIELTDSPVDCIVRLDGERNRIVGEASRRGVAERGKGRTARRRRGSAHCVVL